MIHAPQHLENFVRTGQAPGTNIRITGQQAAPRSQSIVTARDWAARVTVARATVAPSVMSRLPEAKPAYIWLFSRT